MTRMGRGIQGVILAAGKGTRLGKLTTNRSKAMLPILGKPIVERVMEDMVANGVEDFILVISPDDRHITRYFREESGLGVRVRFITQPEPLGMAKALQCAAPFITGDFILSAFDNLVSAGHVWRMIERFEEADQPEAVLSLMRVEPERWGSVAIVEMEGGWVKQIIEKPGREEAASDLASLPLYLFTPRILDYLPRVGLSQRGEYELQDAIQMLIEGEGRVCGVMAEGRLNLTDAADLLAINLYYLSKTSEQQELSLREVGLGTRFIPPVYIGSGTRIGAYCRIGPQVYIEGDCWIGDLALIREAVILRGVRIPAGSRIEKRVVA